MIAFERFLSTVHQPGLLVSTADIVHGFQQHVFVIALQEHAFNVRIKLKPLARLDDARAVRSPIDIIPKVNDLEPVLREMRSMALQDQSVQTAQPFRLSVHITNGADETGVGPFGRGAGNILQEFGYQCCLWPQAEARWRNDRAPIYLFSVKTAETGPNFFWKKSTGLIRPVICRLPWPFVARHEPRASFALPRTRIAL